MIRTLEKIGILSILLFSIPSSLFAQAPEKMSYQAIIRNSGGNLVTSHAIGMRISILQGSTEGTEVYVETHTASTNANGLVSLSIGTGTASTGSFSEIDWANGPYFIRTETDPEGGTSYTISGTSELLSVPYALYAKTSGSTQLGFADFYAMMPPDNAATVAPGSDVSFPQNGPSSNEGSITRIGPSGFNLASIGTYQVSFNISITEAGQFVLTLDGSQLSYTTVGRATGTSQIVGTALVTTNSNNSILTVRNPASSSTALTVTPLAGGTEPVSAHLVITRIR